MIKVLGIVNAPFRNVLGLMSLGCSGSHPFVQPAESRNYRYALLDVGQRSQNLTTFLITWTELHF